MASFQVLFAFLLLLLVSPNVEAETIVCNGDMPSKFPFCDRSLLHHFRAMDLVNRMTLEEKVAQLGDSAAGVPRLNLPPYNWWSEALHGVSDVGRGTHFDALTPSATSFPTVILAAASFNETLWKQIGVVVSNEARALYNVGLSGLTFWSPNVNLVRDPRWGRTSETPGEDPFVIGKYAVNYVRGLQDVEGYTNIADPNGRPLKVGACCKHYVAYDVDKWTDVDRFHFDAQVTQRDMVEKFLYPFEMCVKEGDVVSVMCSYNKVNGIPTCADPSLNSVVREQWGLHGYIVADCDAIDTIVTGHHYNDTFPAAVAQSLVAGLDLDCGITSPRNALEAVQKGLVQEAKIDEALRNLYVVLMRLGWFDGSYSNYSSLGRSDVCKPEAIELAAEAARQGIVLLKNDKHTLPFNFNSKKPTLAVLGPHANATYAMIGNYAIKNLCRYSTPLGALGMYGIVKYAPGCLDVKCPNIDGFSAAVEATKGADATVLFVGLDLSIEAESLDRVDLKLPINQETLVNSAVNASTGPVVLVVLSAGCIDISAFKNNPKVPAIVWAGYPGAEGGRAIADILFGHYNPGGRLPITWYPAEYTLLLPMTSMQLRPNPELGYPGRTYKFYNGTTIYPFGYGLSYTQFKYTISAPKSVSYTRMILNGYQDSTVTIVVGVTNTGNMDGSHVVLLYSVPPSDIIGAPIKGLIGFESVFIKRRETVQVRFDLNGCKSFSIIDKGANELVICRRTFGCGWGWI